MEGRQTGDDRLAEVAAAFRAGAQIYSNIGSPLFAALCTGAAEDPGVIELASHAQAGGKPVHLFCSVHYLLLGDRNAPLARYFATLTADPAPPGEAFPAFARFCADHRDEILELLASRTVQTTYVDRCRALLAPLALVAEEAGEPLNLIEIGCSAGVLLTFDKYAYELTRAGRIGAADAPLILKGELHGGPPLRIPRIGGRIGLDLHPLDARSPEERRWLLALCFPEFRDEQARLAIALDVVAHTDIRMFEGDALERLPTVLAETPGPLCVFHSACLFYWPASAKAALEALLLEASRDREIHRVGIEPSECFDSWHAGRADTPEQPSRVAQASGEVTLSRYRGGEVERRVVARLTADYGEIEWIGG